MIEATRQHLELRAAMYQHAMSGWYLGDEATLRAHAAVKALPSRTDPSVFWTRLVLTRNKVEAKDSWFGQSEYEFCWQLSISARPADEARNVEYGKMKVKRVGYRDLPEAEEAYWAAVFFPGHTDKLWAASPESQVLVPASGPAGGVAPLGRDRRIASLRLFLHPQTGEPFNPMGEPLGLVRWKAPV